MSIAAAAAAADAATMLASCIAGMTSATTIKSVAMQMVDQPGSTTEVGPTWSVMFA
jgi:hypothetical protein